jgi:hypothetical protein
VLPPSPNTSLASATELIRNPISPRDTIALPRMAAGYRDFGLGIAVLLRGVFAVTLVFDVIGSAFGTSLLGLVGDGCCNELLPCAIAVSRE